MTVSEARPRRSRYFAALVRLRWLVVGAAVLLAILGGVRTVRTYGNLRSDLAELLPENAPSVQALTELRDRLPGIRHLGVVVQVSHPDALPAAYRFVDVLAERVRRYPTEMVAAVRVDSRLEREFAERYALQLMDPADVRALREAVERRRDWDVTRQMGLDLADDEEDPRPSIPFAELRQKYEARFGKPQLREGDRFVSPDGKSVVLLIQAAAQGTGHAADAALLERVQADVDALGFPRAFDARLELGYGGDVATRVEEAEGLQSDLTLSGVMVIVLVLGVLYWFFGSLTALPLLGVPLFVGTVAAFGLVALPPFSIHSLNSNTAFLGSIVLGNGINAGIILLARYTEERRAGAFRELAIDRAVHGTYSATAAAALAAAASYASLVFTDFRGFNQFGWIGALGLILCWVAMYTLLPLLLHWFGEGIGRKPVRRLPRVRSMGGFSLMSTLRAWPRAVLVGAALVSSLAVAGLVRRAGDWIEYDLSKLRRADSWQDGERFWGPRMDAALGRYLTPTVILARTAEEARQITARVRGLADAGGAGGLISQVRSLETFLPPGRAEGLEEAERLKELLTPRMKQELSARDRELVDQALSDEALVPLRVDQIPSSLLMGLREYTGRSDRNVLVFPKLNAGTWDAERLDAFASDLRAAARVGNAHAGVAGGLPLAGDIARAMEADGPRATALSLLAVLVICWFAFRIRRDEPGAPETRILTSIAFSLAAISSLIVAVVLMLGGLAWGGAKLNFCNFVALPITFGIGADYSINVLQRYLLETSGEPASAGTAEDVDGALSSTSNAVALCSATTVIGFGSLIMAQNRALSSFGVFAIAGELASLVVGVVIVPAGLSLWERRQKRARAETSPEWLRQAELREESSTGNRRRSIAARR